MIKKILSDKKSVLSFSAESVQNCIDFITIQCVFINFASIENIDKEIY